MSRFALLFLTLVGLSTVAPAWADDLAGPALLRSAVTVADPVIRVGDLFDGAPANADVAVAHAPAPGESVVLDARWLLAVARAQHVAWTPASRFDQSGVTRASQLIGTDAVRAAVADAVAEITALIVAQRAYEMNSKVITTADQMLQSANQVKS